MPPVVLSILATGDIVATTVFLGLLLGLALVFKAVLSRVLGVPVVPAAAAGAPDAPDASVPSVVS